MVKRLLTALFQQRLPSSFAALEVYLPLRQLRKIISTTPDKRRVFEGVAFALGMTEEELVFDLARRLRLPFYSEVITPFGVDISVELLQQFINVGAVPIVEEGFIIGAVCVDPASVEQLLPEDQRQKVAISTWKLIESAANKYNFPDSTGTTTQTTAKPETFSTELELGLQILELVLEEALSYSATHVSVQPDGVNLTYSFITIDNQKAEGTINSSVIAPFLAALDYVISKNGSQYEHLEQVFKVEMLDERKYSLSLSDSIKESDSINEIDAEEQPILNAASNLILLIEDDPIFAKIVDRFLGTKGYTTLSINSSRKALNHLLSNPNLPALIVCDLHLPGLSGIELTEYLKNDKRYASVPIIMLTSDSDEATEIACIQAGAVAHLPKSKDPLILCAHIQRILAERGQ